MKDPQTTLVIPHKTYAPVKPINFLKERANQQNSLNKHFNTGGSKKNITYPSFDNSLPATTPNHVTQASYKGNRTFGLSRTRAKYDDFAFKGGKIIRVKKLGKVKKSKKLKKSKKSKKVKKSKKSKKSKSKKVKR